MDLFKGKIGRLKYFGWSMLVMLLGFVVALLAGGLVFVGSFDNDALDLSSLGYGALACFIVYIVGTVVLLGITSKRLRDVSHSPWWCLVMFVPYVNFAGWVYLCIRPGFVSIPAKLSAGIDDDI